MRRCRFLLAALLSMAPATLVAQRREPAPLPPSATVSVFLASRHDPPRPELEQRRVAGVLQHAAIGALAGAALGFGASLIQENTIPHTDHEMDPLVRFGSMAVGVVVGTVSGVLVHGLRTR